MKLSWYQCVGGYWCELNKIDLQHQNLKGVEGVYIVWCGLSERIVLRVGQGVIRDEISRNRNDIIIQAFSQLNLHVTWAGVEPNERNSIESYLTIELKPKFPKAVDRKQTTKVNMPW